MRLRDRRLTWGRRDAKFRDWGGPGLTLRDYLGIVMTKRGDGEVVLELDADERHLNMSGIVHGGVLATMADSAIGLAVQTKIDLETYFTTAAQLNISFMRAAQTGPLKARGFVTTLGRRLAFGEAEVWQGDTLVAKGSGVVYIKRRVSRAVADAPASGP